MVNDGREKFDAIVIGSGIGGLTVAAVLSKFYRKKVLVIEQHFTPGGFTHDFERQHKFSWDVGLNYVGEMGKGDLGRAVFDYITNGKLKWHKFPDLMEKFIYPDLTFTVSSNPQQYQADLIAQFPHEQPAIQRYFRDVQTAALCLIIHALIEVFPSWLQPLLYRLFKRFGSIATQTTQAYLDRNFQDPRLKALIVSQLGTYNLPPSRSSFGMNSLIVAHYLNGAWYPVGGGKSIFQGILPTIEQSGGMVITKRRVTEILIESGVAVGVKVNYLGNSHPESEIYHAPIVVSNAGIVNTYTKLIPPNYAIPERKSIENFPKGKAAIVLYLGLKEHPRKLGFKGENHWIYTSYDHESFAQSSPVDANHPPDFCFCSFPSLNNPLAVGHTAEIIVPGNYDFFVQWREKPWKRRGEDYLEVKRQIIESILNSVERQYPGFKNLIEYTELATPITFENFAASNRGAIYGLPGIPERFNSQWISSNTPIKNLYVTGSDVFSSGIMGAMMGGLKTAGLMNGTFGFLKIMLAVMTSKSAVDPETSIRTTPLTNHG